MNYEMFQTYMKVFRFDEVRIIGKDICIDDEWIHIVGMGRKKEGSYLYILDRQPPSEGNFVWRPDQTNRESMLASEDRHAVISKIKIGEETYELQGSVIGNLAQQAETAEAYFFFQQMIENGWRIPEDSYFYHLEWNCIGLEELRLKDTYEKLPELSGEIRQLTFGPSSRNYIVQVPVCLEKGKINQLSFSLGEYGEEVVCYINQVNILEPFIEEQKRFEDVQYQERALQHITAEEFEKMKKMALEAIEADCPAGMGYFTVEYECTKEELSAQFFAVSYLDSFPEYKKGGTSMVMMGGKPEQETGPHGYRSRCAVIQYAVPVETKVLDAELFMLIETIREKEVAI